MHDDKSAQQRLGTQLSHTAPVVEDLVSPAEAVDDEDDEAEEGSSSEPWCTVPAAPAVREHHGHRSRQ